MMQAWRELGKGDMMCMKKIYIFGVGKGKEYLKGCILKENVQVLAYVDNCAEVYVGKKVDGLSVIKPQDMSPEFEYVVVSLMQYKEVRNQLLEMGIDAKTIISFFSYEDSENSDYWEVIGKDEWHMELLWYHYRTKLLPYLQNVKYEIADEIRCERLYFPIIRSSEEAIDRICKERCSLARFGDGEFELMQVRNRSKFQTATLEFAERLKKVLWSNDDRILIAIADNYGALDKYTDNAAEGIRYYLTPTVREEHMALLESNKIYYDAYLSRPYMMYKDKKGAKDRFDNLKRLWDKQDILIVEGKDSKSGIGNDLFENASSIQRILAPNKDAYLKYHEIYNSVCAYGKNKLILISLGATATILAYDLTLAGYWALDIGQIDMEYEWYLRGAECRCNIPYKNISEVSSGDVVIELDKWLNDCFRCQVIDKII